ncbi:uncharacterized protein LOC129594808 [Paramacrobiotus metropolitanus]|uniref:uncharacterized protein LOC129594808 n=1 Tax=Paramacrobiotus metropolitanus TaxID=2943436 RepID=UPI0024463B39|nr:uncharacterized protein LOC129594808 [Paramacrobiotus metropolitanus]
MSFFHFKDTRNFFIVIGFLRTVSAQSSATYPPYVGLDNYSNTASATLSPSTTGNPSNGFCGIPNAVRGQNIDVDKMTGIWYGYGNWYIGIDPNGSVGAAVNNIQYFESLGNGLFPTTTIPASIMYQEQSFYWNATDSTCQYNHEISYMTNDGRQIGVYFNPVDPVVLTETVGVDNAIVLATDYDVFSLFYVCYLTNTTTGFCVLPDIYINTRKKAQDVTGAEKQKMTDAINNALKPFCLDISAFLIQIWIDSKADCPRISGSPCFQNVGNAFYNTAETFT